MKTTHTHCAIPIPERYFFGFLVFELRDAPIGYGKGSAPYLHLCLAVTKKFRSLPVETTSAHYQVLSNTNRLTLVKVT